VSSPGQSTVTASQSFDPTRRWRLHPQVALRDETFGALAYHYGNRRLIFLRSRTLVALVQSLQGFDSADEALDSGVEHRDRPAYERALARLAASEIIDAF
jgi:mycofactocin biosynthesis protein MftB